ncbi:MAG: peptidase associated/transthyretin-like domain-containing protein, partial [Acidimicrobiales bacterium]
MRKRLRTLWLTVAVAMTVAGTLVLDVGTATAQQNGTLVGHVEVLPGDPPTDCRVGLTGTPFGAVCDGSGQFRIDKVPPGTWELQVVTSMPDVPAKKLLVGVNPGMITDVVCPAIELAQPGTIAGNISGGSGGDLTVFIPDQGLATRPDGNGNYLLQGVAPGFHDVQLLVSGSLNTDTPRQEVFERKITTANLAVQGPGPERSQFGGAGAATGTGGSSTTSS